MATRALHHLDRPTVTHLIEDTFLSTSLRLYTPVHNGSFRRMIIACHQLIQIGKIQAKNIINSLENSKPINLKPYFKKITSLTNTLSHDPSFCKSIFDKFVQDTINEAQELEEIAIERSYRPTHTVFDQKAIINLTDISIPGDISLVLSFGPKFCFPPKNNLLNTVEFLDDFCFHLDYDFPIETHLETYKQLSIEFNHQYGKSRKTREIWLDFLHYRLNNFLRNHPNLLITRSDKGKHTVLLSKEMYEAKMCQLVTSTDDYVSIDNLSADELEAKNNRFVQILISKGTIEKKDAYLYKDVTCFIAQLYGLIKIHKENKPVRPIVSACAAPGFKLAKLFTSILSSVFCEMGFHVKDSMDFVERVKQVKLAPHDILISFDVVSMFTNLPIDHLISIIETRKNTFTSRFNINFDTLKAILIFILKECAVFSWNNTYYKQKDSLAMGSPLSPILAKILMTHLIDTILGSLDFKPKFLALYVDDSFWVVDSDQLNPIFNKLNQYHPKIKFTLEKEKKNTLNFLDVSVIRDELTLITNWYSKPFSSDRLLNYFSHHESTCVIETAKAFIRRVLTLSDGRFFHENKVSLERILRANSFPETEIIGLIRENYTFMKPTPKKDKFTGTYVPIKFRGLFTSRLKSKIHPFLLNARLVGTPDRADSKHFSYLKDIIQLKNKINGVLIISCKCKAKKIIRHTDFAQRVDNILAKLSTCLSGPSRCSTNTHCFSSYSFIQCKNSTSAKRKHQMLSYFYRKDLIDTKFDIPIFKIYEQNDLLKVSTKCK